MTATPPADDEYDDDALAWSDTTCTDARLFGHPESTAPPGRWDGWDDPDYEPTQSELEEPILPPLPPGTTPEDVARALLRPSPPVHWPDPTDEYTHLD